MGATELMHENLKGKKWFAIVTDSEQEMETLLNSFWLETDVISIYARQGKTVAWVRSLNKVKKLAPKGN